jgi:glycosyltransferase involved in cell wall biosynthesis
VHYLPKKILGCLPFSPYYMNAFKKDTDGESFSAKRRIHVLAYYMYGMDVERVIDSVKPDIVSIRGIGFITRPFILACKRKGVKYVISLHGAISLSDTTKVTKNEQKMERELFRDAAKGKEIVTVIATGIRTRVLQSIGLEPFSDQNVNRIKVINNGIDAADTSFQTDVIRQLRRKYNISEEDKVIISAGTICERKNQLQILRAFHILSEADKAHTKLLFLGKGELFDALNAEIENLGESDRVFACGYIPVSEVQNYFAISDLNVIASIDEGFGRAFVEGFLLGVPAVAYSDLDAVEDLYDECAMVKVPTRSDEALSKGIAIALQKKWDRNMITSHAHEFSIRNMVTKYENLYESLIQ